MNAVTTCCICAAALVLGFASNAQACSWAPYHPAPLAAGDAGTGDGGVPGTVSVNRVTVGRGETGCGEGTFGFKFELPGQKSPGDLGYSVKLASGTLPPGLTLPTEPIGANACCGIPTEGWCLGMAWDDGSPPHAPFSFSVVLAAVNADGKQGPGSAPVEVTNGGASDPENSCAPVNNVVPTGSTGCSTSPRGGDRKFHAALGLVALGMIRQWRRRVAAQA